LSAAFPEKEAAFIYGGSVASTFPNVQAYGERLAGGRKGK